MSKSARWLLFCIYLSTALFVFILFVSAWADKSIRVLHVFEAIPYIAAPLLCEKRPKVGYSLAFASGTFWILIAGFFTTFIRNGFERAIMLIETGTVDRPDILLSVPAFFGTLGISLFSTLGYLQLNNKSWKDFFLLLVMIIAILLFFILIFAAFAPQYLGIFKWLIGSW
jgi:hypothetical protein